MKAFDGIRVVDFSHVIAGPFCTYQLALLGAEVIKIEQPGSGDYMRGRGSVEALRQDLMGDHYACQNGNKRSVVLDLATQEGRNAARHLVTTADVVVENFRPGVMARLGLDYPALAAVNPRLVYCSLSGFGQDGPLAGRPVYDNVVQAFSGLMAMTGTDTSGPLKAGAPVLDYASGTMAAFAVSSALLRRERSGLRQFIDVSMLDTAFLLMNPVISSLLNGGRSPVPQVDVLMRTTTWTHSRDANLGLDFTTVSFFDGQGFLVRRDSNVARATDLRGATICTTSGTTSELNLADWSRARNIQFRPVLFEQIEEATRAYESGRCDALSTDASVLASIAAIQPNSAQHLILPDLISKEPHSPVVRQGDDQWGDIVRWTLFALLSAEELGVTQANVDEMLRSTDPEIRRLLGASGDHGPMMGLDARWAYNALKAVGNYGEIFDRNLGANSPTRLPRGLNALWMHGGAMYGMPIR